VADRVFILLIACMNFINLSTAQAVNRAKEVGVRKVLGSDRTDLKVQFLLETFLIVFCSLLLALGITELALPPLAKVLDLGMTTTLLYQPMVVYLLVGLAVAVTLLAGFYPAVVLAGFNPVTALKSKVAAKGIALRRGLVVLQFVIAQGLIIATVIMLRQMNYFQHASMGFDKEAVVDVSFPADSVGITKIDYLKTYNLPLAAGRNFEAQDSIVEFLITEQAVKQLGLRRPEDALNKQIDLWGYFKGPVVGVVKDFHTTGLKDGIIPVLITKFKQGYSTAGMKLYTGDVPGTLAAVGKLRSGTSISRSGSYRGCTSFLRVSLFS
jgi:putative ABC transport system permease protein